MVTASNAGGQASVSTASVGLVLPAAPADTIAPGISGTAEQGDTLTAGGGVWNNGPTGYTCAWQDCGGQGTACSPIGGATSSSYALSAADIGSTVVCVVTATGPGGSTPASTKKTAVVIASPIPVASQPTTTNLLVTPASPGTNQSVTLIATVTAGTSSTALWGNVTFENGGAAIGGCTNLPVAPSGQSATVACSTCFSASSAQLNAAFTPTSVTVGDTTNYTAMVTLPAARPGPLGPTGSVEFLDDGQSIGSCASQSLSGGEATCSVSYASAGTHEVSAEYSGDANCLGSNSPAAQVSATPIPTTRAGRDHLDHAMAVLLHPRVHDRSCPCRYPGVARGDRGREMPPARVPVRDPYNGPADWQEVRAEARQHLLHGRQLQRSRPPSREGSSKVGARITVSIVRPNWVGKTYGFVVRSRLWKGPTIQIGSPRPRRVGNLGRRLLAPGPRSNPSRSRAGRGRGAVRDLQLGVDVVEVGAHGAL